jgi:beta-xylosidase
VADDPAGPFMDSGKPLVAERPEGINRGQVIDPDVFHDPVSDKYYLYWGNGFMACAELNEDMISINTKTLKTIKTDGTFREGTEVFYRNGLYYFMWSENDTRDADYRVRYATSDSAAGPLNIPVNNLVIAKDADSAIYGTGHNCVLQIPGKDEWYIVYHRFTRPKGITMGRAAGYNREVCIDRLEFNEDGSIKMVKPTLEGIVPIK